MGWFDRASRIIKRNPNPQVAEDTTQAASPEKRTGKTSQYSKLMSEALSKSKQQDALALQKVDDCLAAIKDFLENSSDLLFVQFIKKVAHAKNQKSKLYKLIPPKKNATRQEIEDYLTCMTANAFIEIETILRENRHLEQEIHPKIHNVVDALFHLWDEHHQSSQIALNEGDENKAREAINKKGLYMDVIRIFGLLSPDLGPKVAKLSSKSENSEFQSGDIEAELNDFKTHLDNL